MPGTSGTWRPASSRRSSPSTRAARRWRGSVAVRHACSAAPCRPRRNWRSACPSGRRCRSSRRTSCRPWPTRARRACSRSRRPARRRFGLLMPISVAHRRAAVHRHVQLSPDDPRLPQRRRQLHRRPRQPRRAARAGRRRLAAHRLRADGRGQRLGGRVQPRVCPRRSCRARGPADRAVPSCWSWRSTCAASRESGTIFASPTYIFIGSMLLMVGTGGRCGRSWAIRRTRHRREPRRRSRPRRSESSCSRGRSPTGARR